ncbi:MobF family relaxase [Picosynechococcus sp. NKBG15041c]|uniref:MobF family relaxase n=1 Tax=Picosynechococcus sp. NKBG15041c TaxID=1407650 RepID=UPI0003F72145|nr:MobF family relaxase [Picosynechococcus sp. NKBG15041c]
MLSIATMTPAKAGSYYKENYYAEEEQVEFSEWWGKGAAALGLMGKISDGKIFQNILQGRTADGQTQLRQAPPKGKEAIAGTDLTFSAPKSISIAALVNQEQDLIDAHNQAVERVLNLIEERYGETRINKQHTPVQNICVAKFLHDTNRELNPNLHTHCLVMNVAQDASGTWRSAANRLLYHHRILLGKIYRNELAQAVQKLGYEIEVRADGLFELKGYTREQIDGFSDRHQQILEYLKTEGLDDTNENRIKALFETRKIKQHDVDRQALLEEWQSDAKNLGIEHPTPNLGNPVSHKNLTVLVDQAIRHSEERTAIFTREDLEAFIVAEPTGHSFEEIEAAIDANPRLIRRGLRLATEESLIREKMTIALMQEGQGKLAPILTTKAQLPGVLTTSQTEAVNHALRSRDRVLGWVGVAGAGKTFTLNTLVKIAQAQGIEVSGFAPDASSAEVLGDEVGIATDTVAYHLLQQHEPSQKRQLWIIDEAGKLSAQEAYQLLLKSSQQNAQILLVGDPKQLTAVNAGAPLKSLIDHGLSATHLKDFLRQKDSIIARAVQLTYHNLGGEAIAWLQKHEKVSETLEVEDRAQQIAAAYLKLNEAERAETLVLSGTHRERHGIIHQLRVGLKHEGKIEPPEYVTETLGRKDMTEEQKQHARFYAVGDVLIPFKDHNCLKRSKRYQITQISGDDVTLNEQITLNLKGLKYPLTTEVFIKSNLSIAVGDRLKWTRNNRLKKRINGQEFTVTAIDPVKRIISIVDDKGRLDEFSLDELNHCDHALVGTVYSSQGKTAERVFVSFGNDPTVNRESILVALSRAKYEARIWTTNIQKLKELAGISHNQTNPSELLKEQGIKLPIPPAPLHLKEKHWLERVEKSGIAPEVAALNAESLEGMDVYERLLEDHLATLGSGQYVTQPMKQVMDQYATVAKGGVWADGGIDATRLPHLIPGEISPEKAFGEFKADHPRLDWRKTQQKGSDQYRKYEAPKDVPKGIIFPKVPEAIAEKIYAKYGVNPSPEQRKSGFWACVYWYPEIAIIPVEGKKKAESVISQGYAAIALPSVTGGYRSREDGVELPKRRLHPELAVFATNGRQILMAFDQDTKQNTVQNVRRDLVRTGELLEEAGCKVSVLKWQPHEGKGIDDLIVNQGVERLMNILGHAIPLAWEAEKHYRNEYLKLRNYLLKTQGQGRKLTELMIDTAIAYTANSQDRIKILHQSNTLEARRKQGIPEDAKTYQAQIEQELQRLQQKLKPKRRQKM